MTQQVMEHYDITIVGGGMAGATMALALAPLNLAIAIIEVYPYQKQKNQPSFDDRCLALAWSSRQIYQSMGLWDKLAQRTDGFTAIEKIHISDRGYPGITRLDHKKENVPALGYVVESRVMGEVLQHEMKNHDNIHLFCPATIEHSEHSDESVHIKLKSDGQEFHFATDLLVIADGVNSKTRASLGIQVEQHSYAQTAIIANIKTAIPHNNIAYERFTDSGPLAVLPLSDERCSLVWTTRDAQLEQLMALNDAEFCAALQQHFGYRLGKIEKVGRRVAYPLVLMTVNNDTLSHQKRVALIGNAAHGVHPVAGQGFNLGLRDIAALAELIVTEMHSGHNADPGNKELLTAYWQWRQADIRQVSTVTNSLIKVFSNNSKIMAVVRNSGLLLTDISGSLKHAIAHEAMGNGVLQGRLSKMAVGRSLYKNISV